ncbi:L10-interacting MYB domain-containing protein-like [Lotus japonicus]|uniref:L10-interacting MYB domain-containing protein-like n=1 Tax=Lotus japonicus TaxID=34305 RepID=UPI00258AA0FC|nr:L10-interacting MYB domain-containing protein-like [Lotus japonicus]
MDTNLKEGVSNSESSQKNAKLIPYTTKVLLDLCMDEIRKSGKPGISFKSKKWEEIRDEFEKRTTNNYLQKQLRNRMDSLRIDWLAWKQLRGKETGLGWNNQTGTFDADSAWWDAKIRVSIVNIIYICQ